MDGIGADMVGETARQLVEESGSAAASSRRIENGKGGRRRGGGVGTRSLAHGDKDRLKHGHPLPFTFFFFPTTYKIYEFRRIKRINEYDKSCDKN